MEDGIKTFPFPVKVDDKVRMVEAEFGIVGFAVVWKLHQAIYQHGYYLKWDIDTQLLFIDDYRLSKVGRSAVSEIVACCLRRGVFESSMFENYQILTSERIQETFLTAKERSKKVIVNKDYALPVVYTFIENANKKGKNVNIFFKNADIFPIKERKGKEIKEDDAVVCYGLHNNVHLTETEYSRLLSELGESALKDYINRLDSWLTKKTINGSHANVILKWYTQDKPKPQENSSPSADMSKVNEHFNSLTEEEI